MQSEMEMAGLTRAAGGVATPPSQQLLMAAKPPVRTSWYLFTRV